MSEHYALDKIEEAITRARGNNREVLQVLEFAKGAIKSLIVKSNKKELFGQMTAEEWHDKYVEVYKKNMELREGVDSKDKAIMDLIDCNDKKLHKSNWLGRDAKEWYNSYKSVNEAYNGLYKHKGEDAEYWYKRCIDKDNTIRALSPDIINTDNKTSYKNRIIELIEDL